MYYDETKLLVENWHCFGRDEELLTESPTRPEDLGPGMKIKVMSSNFGLGGFLIKLVDLHQMRKTDGHIEGELHCVRPMPSDYGKALGAYEVTRARAPKGFGPLLYDVAMELTTEAGSGIMADRRNVTPAARRIWKHYLDRRPDVEAVQLDDMRNTLTQTPADNAMQNSSTFEFYDNDDGTRLPRNTNWLGTSLSMMYRVRNGTTPTLDKLRSLGKLDDWR